MNETARNRLHAPSFTTLFVVLIVVLLFPSASWIPDIAPELIFDVVLIAGVISAGGAGRHWVPLVVLTIVTLGSRWLDLSQESVTFSILSASLTFTWTTYTITIILTSLLQGEHVNANTIVGVLVGYLLSAIAFAILFVLVETLAPGSYEGLTRSSNDPELFNEVLYFSLVSITTMGYGDITPVTSFARTLAALEGVYGQIYMTVMVARLVGLHITADKR